MFVAPSKTDLRRVVPEGQFVRPYIHTKPTVKSMYVINNFARSTLMKHGMQKFTKLHCTIAHGENELPVQDIKMHLWPNQLYKAYPTEMKVWGHSDYIVLVMVLECDAIVKRNESWKRMGVREVPDREYTPHVTMFKNPHKSNIFLDSVSAKVQLQEMAKEMTAAIKASQPTLWFQGEWFEPVKEHD